MKYIKKFEFGPSNDNMLYQNKDFEITRNLIYCDDYTRKSAILAMADLVGKKSKYLHTKKLRNVEIQDNQKKIVLDYFEFYDKKIENIKKFRSSEINEFINDYNTDYNDIENIPIDIYMNLTFQYYPIISKAIEKSKTLGDIIDYFTQIRKDILKDLEQQITAHKYGL